MTIKEVKKHFKNAKEVESVYRGSLFKIKGNYHWYDNSVFCADTEGIERSLWDAEKGFAKITKHKPKKIKVSEELVKGYHKDACQEFKTQIEKDFPKLFPKPELEVGKWYTRDSSKDLMHFVTDIKEEEVFAYGLNYKGEWKETKRFGDVGNYNNDDTDIRPATDEEVKDALMKEARRKYKVGDKVNCLYEDDIKVLKNLDVFENLCNSTNELWSDYAESSNCQIFKDGKWATIITPPKEIEHEGNTYVLKGE